MSAFCEIITFFLLPIVLPVCTGTFAFALFKVVFVKESDNLQKIFLFLLSFVLMYACVSWSLRFPSDLETSMFFCWDVFPFINIHFY